MSISSTAASARLGLSGLAAERGEVVKGLNEARVGAILVLDRSSKRAAACSGSLILELVHRGLPFLKMGRLIGEKGLQGLDELFGLGIS